MSDTEDADVRRKKSRHMTLADAGSITIRRQNSLNRFRMRNYPALRKAIVSLPRPFPKHSEVLKEVRSNKKKSRIKNEILGNVKSDKDRVAPTPDGILGFHILELETVSLRVTSFQDGIPAFYYVVASLGDAKRMTKVVQSITPKRVRVDSLIFFNAQVSNFRGNYRNKLKLEVWTFQDPDTHYILGTKEIHLYTFIQKVHSVESVQVWMDGLHACTLIYEFAFAYGAFGYGHSNQLKNSESSVYDTVCHSMFPRIRLADNDIVDNKFNIRVPPDLQVMALSSFIYENEDKAKTKKMSGSGMMPEDPYIEPKAFRMHQVEFEHGYPIYAKVNMKIHQKEIEPDFNEAYGEFICISGRRDRIKFLENLVYGALEDVRDKEHGELFTQLDPDIAEKVLTEEDDLTRPNHPKSRPCTVYPPAKVLSSDEAFLNKFNSDSRTSGYLARIFGFAPASSNPHFKEENIPINHTTRYVSPQPNYLMRGRVALRHFWNSLAWFIWAAFRFVLPDITEVRKVPEISVTLASPQESTTDLYISWVAEEENRPIYGGLKHFKEVSTPVEYNAAKLDLDKGAGQAVKDQYFKTPEAPRHKEHESDLN